MGFGTKAFEKQVSFTLDGQPYSFATWSDTSALWAIRFLGQSDRPKRGCELGECGTCESLVDGVRRRLCLMPSTDLDGLTIAVVDRRS